MSTIPNQSTACWPLSSHQHCFSYLLGKWCFLVPKNSFTEYFSRFLFSPTLSLYALNLRPKSPQKTLLLVQFFLLSWKEEKYVGEKFFLTYDRIIITTGICPKTFAPIYPHYKSFDSYIKPQLVAPILVTPTSCISFDSYIKPQPSKSLRDFIIRCISFDSYIKPQHSWNGHSPWWLYIFWFLHQTTTRVRFSLNFLELYIFWFLHQTTTEVLGISSLVRCISFDSYIKPQPQEHLCKVLEVVYLLIPTSNHNLCEFLLCVQLLYIFWFLHQTTTLFVLGYWLWCCISFDSYIKPQLNMWRWDKSNVVYLLIPTSNHNHP